MKILVVEDETRMRHLLHRGLTEEGHTVDLCATAAEAFESARYTDYDVIVLDWGLPDEDGMSVLRTWRQEGLNTPVLMLTARGSVGERVLGLRNGADDYLVKPFDFEELVARLGAIYRRAAGQHALATEMGDLKFLRVRRQLEGPVATVELTSREFQLFCAFIERPEDVRTRSELLANVWGTNYDGDPNVIEVYVGYLRAKLAAAGTADIAIQTVRGTGYRLTCARPAPGAPQ